MTDIAGKEAMDKQCGGTRGKFAAMILVYFAGTLNDNFCRQGVMLLAVAGGTGKLQSYATVLFTVPFIIFAAYAGFLSDRFSKRSVMIGVKLFTVAAYILGATGLCLMSWPIILITVFIIGIQATIFSPAIYGSIPELYPAEYVVTANGIFNAAANAAILSGIAVAGIVLDIKGSGDKSAMGVELMAGICVILAVVALIASTLVPKFPAASPRAKFPWRGPIDTVAALLRTREDSLLAKSIFIKGFFWLAGSLQILIINAMVLNQFRQTMTMTSIMVGIELVGIGVGSILSPVFAQGKRWYRGLVPSGLLMAAGMFAVAVVPYLPGQACKPAVAGALLLIGIGGGVFCIPVTSFIQVRPAAEIKGKIIAASNLADFTGILVAGGVYYVFDRLCIKPTSYFALEALMVMAIVLWLMMTLPKEADNA